MITTQKQLEQGSSLMEVVISIVLFSLVAMFLFNLMLDSYRTNFEVLQDGKALTFADEGYGAVLSIRDRGWNGVASNGVYGLAMATPGYWVLSSVPNQLGDFSRVITIEDAYRDASGQLVVSGTPDPNTKKVTTSVSWSTDGRNRDTVIENYLTNWVRSSLLRNGSFAHYGGSPPSVTFNDWDFITTGGYSVESDTGYDTFGVGVRMEIVPLGTPVMTMQQAGVSVSGANAYTFSLMSKGSLPASGTEIQISDEDGFFLNEAGGWQLATALPAGRVSHNASTPTIWAATTIGFVTRPEASFLTVAIVPNSIIAGEYIVLDTVLLSKT